MASRSPAEELDVAGVAVRLSNPDKIYFPELGENGGRKRDLVGYYRTVALGVDDSGDGPLMRATRDRPTFLQRFPRRRRGGEEIYQKHIAKKRPEHVQSTPIVFPSKRTGGDAIRPTVPADLVWAANLGTVTFHTWPTLHPDNDHPDQLRIDLDPQPGTTFDDVRRVAIDGLRPLLDELGFTGFVKTSGGRGGIHVYVPIEPPVGLHRHQALCHCART